jgi:hypothetical protein
VIGGGESNQATGEFSTIPGGKYNSTIATGVTAMGFGAWADVAHDLVIGNNPGVGSLPTTAENVHFRVAGNTSDVHIGRLTNQSAVAGAANKLYLHTILDSNQSRAVSIKAPDTLAASYDLILPADDGTASQFLQTDGSGVLSWATVAVPTLQSVYDSGSPAGTDIQVDANDVLNFVLGTGTSAFSVTANASSGSNPVLSVSNEEIRMTSGGSPVPTVVIADGYVLIDGYLSVTGSTLQINTVVTDADHWLVQPALSSTPALLIKPQVTTALYTADLLALHTGSDAATPAIRVADDGKLIVESIGNLQVVGHNATDGYFLRSDASGNASWDRIQASQVATVFSGTNYIDGYTTVATTFVGLDSVIKNVANSVAALDVNAGAGMTESGSLQAGTLTFDVVGTAGEITANANDIQIANAFSKANFTSFTATSSNFDFNATAAVTIDAAAASNLTVTGADLTVSTVTSGDLNLTSAGDAYMTVANEIFMKDTRSAATSGPSGAFRLSSSTGGGANFSSALRTSAAALGYLSAGATGELGIIDAINTLASSSGSGQEKSVFVIGSGDVRLSGGGKRLALAAPDRGSLELTPAVDGYGASFYPARDLEVYVNGALMLADAAQKTGGTAATDDYYLAIDLLELNFAFALVQGDVITIKNNKPAAGENVIAGWTLVQ